MNSKSLRRLAADHSSLYTAGLPPNYLFPPGHDSSDLSSLDILLAGPVGTPYAGGVWRLHLDIPAAYPAAPPTAQFRTRLWHPNIDEGSGAVCVETLKRDWSVGLRLRDVLVTISCLLIQPNPASALNEDAGKLATEDWEGFCRRAKLMTSIHAAVPANIAREVREAQMRGEDAPLEAGPVHAEKKPQASGKGKGKERVKTTPKRLAAEDEENSRQQTHTQDPESDPESDWIPGPDKSHKPAPRRDTNIFGIKGLDDTMHLGTPPKRVYPSEGIADDADEKENHDTSDPFTTIPPKRNTRPPSPSLHLRAPLSLPRFANPNPFAPIQPAEHPLFAEFSYSWQDVQMLHGEGKLEARKRLSGEEWEDRRKWELKRFRRVGGDLGRWNRGEWGARVGMGRL